MDADLKKELDEAVQEHVKADEEYHKLLMAFVTSNGEPLRLITSEVLMQMQDLEKKAEEAEKRFLEVIRKVQNT